MPTCSHVFGQRPCTAFKPASRTRHSRSRYTVHTHATVQQYQPASQEAQIQEFTDWAAKVGIEFDKVKPAVFGGLRGLAAASDIKEEETVLSVPREMALTLPPVQKCPFPDIVDAEFWQASPWYVKMALKLAVEKLRGSESKLYPYVQQLPKDVGVPSSWEPEAIQQLQYPCLIGKVQEQQQEWDKFYRSLTSSKPDCPITKTDFLWALTCVRSRSFSGPYIGSTLKDRIRLAALVGLLVVANSALGFADLQTSGGAAIAVFVFNIMYEVILSRKLRVYAMCPMIDFLNHDRNTASEASYDYFTDRFSVVASSDYKAGQQVYVSYGKQQNNDSLMLYYGFFVGKDPGDQYMMTRLLKWLEQLQPRDEKRLAKLAEEGLLAGLQEVAVQRTGVPATTLQALRYLLADSSEADKGVASFADGGSPAVEAKVAAALVHALQQELDALGSTLEEDKALLNDKKKKVLPGPLRTAVLYRIEKKQVLAECLGRLQGKETA